MSLAVVPSLSARYLRFKYDLRSFPSLSIQITMFDDAEKHYEQCRGGFACVLPKGNIVVISHFHTGEYTHGKNDGDPNLEIVYVPLNNATVKTGQIVLPDKPDECHDLMGLISEIEEKTGKWLYVSPEELSIFKVQLRIGVASWFLFVYDDITIQERVGGLLGIVGTSGGGKKRWLTVLRQFAYRPIYLLNTIKIPSVFRMAEPWGSPTLLIDEADQRETGSESEWVQFINSRYDGTPIPRYNASTGKTEIFRSFGLTGLALRRMLKDEGTMGRMTKINATISPLALPEVAGNDIFEEFKNIRNKLFYLRLKYYGKLKFIGTSGLPADQSWRGKETLTLFRVMEQIDPEISKDIAQVSKSLTNRETQNLSQTWDGLIINEIYAFISDEKATHEKRQLGHYYYSTWIDKEGKERRSYLNLKYLAERLGTTASDIQRSMVQFKISTYERFRPEGSTKAQRGILMFAFPNDTDRVFMRYVPGYAHELLELERIQKTLPKERDGDSKISKSDDGSVPLIPLVPPHEIPNDFFNNNNMDIYMPGTSGTAGTQTSSESLSKNDPETLKSPLNSDIQVKNDKTDINVHPGYLIRVCTQNHGPLNPFLKLKKGTTFRVHKDKIVEFKYYEFSREPEKGEVLDNDVHFIETLKAAEIPDRQTRLKQLLILIISERPEKSIVNLHRRISDLEPGLSLAETDAALKELVAMGRIHKTEDGHY